MLLELTVMTMFVAAQPAEFIHPGLLHSKQDMERIKTMVLEGKEPWKSGFEVFRNDPQSQAMYKMKGPLEMVGRNPTVGQNIYDPDANAAYQCAIMWCITGDIAYANKAKEIINAWSSTLKSITGRDAVLMAGLGPFKMVNAAEIIRYTNADWSHAEIEQTERHFKEVVYPVVKDFALFANGNWDAAAMQTVMAIGVFCNDRAIFERGLHYYVNGEGNGCLTHYIINDSGQCQESGRDQQHTLLGLGLLAACSEIAWNQGLDLYSYADYRLLKGFEYTARYNLGEDVPFVEMFDRTGKYHYDRISAQGRGRLRSVFEMVYNHYVNRAGIEALYTQKAAEKIRPEGPGRPSADHPGFGTLLFSRTAEPQKKTKFPPAAPGGIIGHGSPAQIKLVWIAAFGATDYTVKRAGTPEGPFEVIASNVKSPEYADINVESDQVYYYTVSASNSIGTSDDAYPPCVCSCSNMVTSVAKFDSVTVSEELFTSRVISPDGNVGIAFILNDEGRPAYKIDYMGKPIVLESKLGFEPDFTNGFEVLGSSTQVHKGQWTNDFGERKIVPDNYNELNINLKHKSGKLMRLTFRTYNEGAALRYSFPEQDTKEFTFTGELTEFKFPEGTWCYEEHGTEGEYKRVLTGDIQPYCERPLTLEYADGLCASLAEAANTAYPRMMLSPLPGVPGALVSALGGRTSNTESANQRHDPTARLTAGDTTPWRMFVVGEKPGDLLERNYLMLNLNHPSALTDTSWIKPGKVMRDTALTTENSKAIIDFAATGGLQYVHLDARWYGSEDARTGDATTVRAPNLDIQEIIRYGREKNVGLIVYVDRRQIKSQRDILFPLYEKWGVKGIKIGFIDVGPQDETVWTTETIAKAAEHHLMLNIHDGYRTTGNNRTYPNLMTVEGIRGNEHWPAPEHNCTLPFTRYIAGIGDYTICYYDRRLKTTHAHQLAMAVVSFSPLQWIYWYDRPSMYDDEPEIEFFRKVPTVWDDTKLINGKIGRFATIARRSGDDWFIGTINNSEPRQLQIPLNFLNEGASYLANIYYDDATIETQTKVGIERRTVNSSAILDVPLVSGGGQAIWITPVSE